MEQQIFKEKNDRVNGVEGSGIFQYRNLREFEKVLFLEHQVKGLIDLLKRKDNHIQEIMEQMDRVIEENSEGKKEKALKAEISSNHRVIVKWKTLYLELLDKQHLIK